MVLWTVVFVIVVVTLLYKTYLKLTSAVCRSGAHMYGKVVVVTGGNSGIGFETAKNLAERGARVILACRSIKRGTEAKEEIIKLTGNKDVHFKQLDLASFKSVRTFCDNIMKTEKRLDVLINNAGAGGLGNIKTVDGNHIGMQVNYFGPFLLTYTLLPILKSSAPSRIINVSSLVHKYGLMDYENLNMEKYWSDYLVYANSKLYINLMTLELSRRLEGTNVTVNALHPGICATNLFRNIKTAAIRNCINYLIGIMYQSPWDASQTSIYLSVSPDVKDMSGLYFSNCRPKQPSKLSKDTEAASKLWEETEKIITRSLSKL